MSKDCAGVSRLRYELTVFAEKIDAAEAVAAESSRASGIAGALGV